MAPKLKRNPIHVYNVLMGFRRASYALAQAIERESLGLIKKEDLRPDIWASP